MARRSTLQSGMVTCCTVRSRGVKEGAGKGISRGRAGLGSGGVRSGVRRGAVRGAGPVSLRPYGPSAAEPPCGR
ncbi:hypothetical protein OQI_37170 [Streptomyces pharetrae CZA14]|uniref:AraC family transcriptional regulator n=1 Tax=Streptomyces pharetrae CZA14 TaxID=1144883 RepID=A0ABX3Y7W2_9ACTN|nr:hypothetical protein OQI_37170 [Streptomyces pharetrae CZA14]